MLQLTAIGRLTKDSEIHTNSKGNQFIVFTLAVNKGYGDNQTTIFVSCCAGGILVNPLSKAKKGSLICVTGDLSTELYQKKDGTTGENIKCLISTFSYISAGNGSKQNGNAQANGDNNNYQPNTSYNGNQQMSPRYGDNPHGNNGCGQPQNNPYGYEEIPLHNGDLPF